MLPVLSESLKFAVGTVLFARSFMTGVHENYLRGKLQRRESKSLCQDRPRGVGLDQERDVLPVTLPSIVEIKKCIPRHCFDPRVSTSMYYVARDLVLVAVAFAAIFWIHTWDNWLLWWSSLLLYWGIQGTFFTAIFVLGHDCGHGSFSHHAWLNDLVGTVLHGLILAPYYMWKLTHRLHHRNTANLQKDEVYYPSPVEGRVLPGFGFGIGWFGYLVLGYSPRNINHFNLTHRVFRGHLIGCLGSLGVLGVVGEALWWWAQLTCWRDVIIYYIVPVFVFASYMVVITFLHHTEVNIPWYADDQWDFVKGQLSTVDRHYGCVHHLIHSIGTHQMHHMFTKIPHYHLEEATVAFRAHFPRLVRSCDEPIVPSFLRMFRKYEAQAKITEGTQVHFYK